MSTVWNIGHTWHIYKHVYRNGHSDYDILVLRLSTESNPVSDFRGDLQYNDKFV